MKPKKTEGITWAELHYILSGLRHEQEVVADQVDSLLEKQKILHAKVEILEELMIAGGFKC